MRKISIIVTALVFLASTSLSVQASDVTPLPEETVESTLEKEDTTLLSPGTVTVVKPEELRGEQKTLPEMLKRIPGLHIVETKGRGAYTVASVRGSTAAEVSVFVDGTLMNLGSEAAVDLSAVPIDNVERIEVYRGYVPVRFAGASIGGVINIITKKPTEPGGAVSLGVGSYGLYKTNISYATALGDGKFLLGANYEQTDGDFEYQNDNNTPYTPEDDYTAKRQNNSYKKNDLLLKWNNENWSVRGGWKKNDRELPYAAPGADKSGSLKGAQLDTEQLDFSVGRRQKTGDLKWGIKADYVKQDKKYNDPNDVLGGWGEVSNEYQNYRTTIEIDGELPIGENNLIEFLANYYSEKLDVTGDIVNKLGGISSFSAEAWNLQLQDTINLNKEGTFWITPIVRYNALDGDGDFAFSVAATAKLNENWTLKASGGSYNRAPNLYERYGDGASLRPNPDLKWEKGTQWDLSAIWSGKVASADIGASITFFTRDAENLIEYVMTSPRYGIYQNIGEAKVNGLELESTVKMEAWDFFLSATWMDSENTAEGDYRKGKQLPNRPELEGLFRVSRMFMEDKMRAFAELHYTANNYFDSAEQIKMENLLTVGFGLSYKINKKSKITIGVDDIFDESPKTRLAAVGNGPVRTLWYPLEGRRFYATWNIDF